MMNYIVFDDLSWGNLLPLTFTRPVAEIRVGILTIREKWEKYLKSTCSWHTQDYLSAKYPIKISTNNILINGSVLPSPELVRKIQAITPNTALVANDTLIAAWVHETEISNFSYQDIEKYQKTEIEIKILKINYPWDIFSSNEQAIAQDFELITHGRKSAELSSTNNLIGAQNIFAEEGVKTEYVTINASSGYVYLGKNSEIMEGSLIRGSLALCENSIIKMGAKIYGATTIGPDSRAAGEIFNSVFFACSNKAHDGFLGNAVLGQWCNLGADTNNSNLKNDYSPVKVWNYPKESFIRTGLQFCGLIMGDHSKCGINTMFNTGTVVGVSSNIFGDGFPRNFVPSFSWGGASGFTVYQIAKAIDVAKKVMERRHQTLDDNDIKILQTIFEKTEKYRNFK